jgi:hypothetical protein
MAPVPYHLLVVVLVVFSHFADVTRGDCYPCTGTPNPDIYSTLVWDANWYLANYADLCPNGVCTPARMSFSLVSPFIVFVYEREKGKDDREHREEGKGKGDDGERKRGREVKRGGEERER